MALRMTNFTYNIMGLDNIYFYFLGWYTYVPIHFSSDLLIDPWEYVKSTVRFSSCFTHNRSRLLAFIECYVLHSLGQLMICVVKIYLLVQLSVDYLPHPFMPILVFFLNQLATIADYAVPHFILISTQFTFAIFPCFIYY